MCTILEFFRKLGRFEFLLPYIHLFNHLFTFICIYLFYILEYNVSLRHLSCCSNCSIFGHWEFKFDSYVPLKFKFYDLISHLLTDLQKQV